MRKETRAEWNIWLFSKCTDARCRKKQIRKYIHPQYIASHWLRSMVKGFCQEGDPTSVKEFLASSVSQVPPPCHLVLSVSSHRFTLCIPLFSSLSRSWANRLSLLPPSFLHVRSSHSFNFLPCQISADVE